ncbi:MAG: helix-turn-helix domain-containing protein, partial [Candidatus Micrarchaeota archaeon]
MLPSVSEVKARRLKLGLKQSELALASGVSQSLIAKMEAERIDASYSRVKAVFDALEQLEEKSELKASHVMNSHV